MSRSPAVKESDASSVERRDEEPRLLPAVDVAETPTELVAVLDLPGVPRDGIDIRYEDRTLTVQGKVGASSSSDRASLWREFHRGNYSRAFSVRVDIDADRISADYEDGVLTVRLPKRDAAGPRKISVK